MGRSRKCNWKRKQLKANKKLSKFRVVESKQGSFSSKPMILLKARNPDRDAQYTAMIAALEAHNAKQFPLVIGDSFSDESSAVYLSAKEYWEKTVGTVSEKPILLVGSRRKTGARAAQKAVEEIMKTYPNVKIVYENEPQKLRGGAPDLLVFKDKNGIPIDPELGSWADQELNRVNWEALKPKINNDFGQVMIFGTAGEYSANEFKNLYEGNFEHQIFSPSGYLNNFRSVLDDKKFNDEVKKGSTWVDLSLSPQIKKYIDTQEKLKENFINTNPISKIIQDPYYDYGNPVIERVYDQFKNPMARLSAEETMRTDAIIIAIAVACHQANKSWCETNGDFSQKDWLEADQWQRDSAIKGVEFRLNNPHSGPDAQHNAWSKEKLEQGWVYGEEKDAEKKTHPCLVPFSQLPEFQQRKDKLFVAIVDALSAPIYTELTFGQKAVGLTFNPNNNESVDRIKRQFADIIDNLNDFRKDPNINGEAGRLASVAITEAQTSQMWAVKAVTWVEV